MARRSSSTLPATPQDGRAYLTKAVEWLEAAEDARVRENQAATVGAAVHAAISAADAIASVLIGARWVGPHGGAPGHLDGAGTAEARACAKHLRILLPLKNRAEYDPEPLTTSTASRALLAASRAVTQAQAVIGKLR